jgi:hypothetical protein
MPIFVPGRRLLIFKPLAYRFSHLRPVRGQTAASQWPSASNRSQPAPRTTLDRAASAGHSCARSSLSALRNAGSRGPSWHEDTPRRRRNARALNEREWWRGVPNRRSTEFCVGRTAVGSQVPPQLLRNRPSGVPPD